MLASIFRQHRWANLTLIDFCIGLTDEQLDFSLPGQFGSIRDTWAHMTEERFLDAVELGVLPAPQPAAAAVPLAELRQRLDTSGMRAIGLALAIDDSQVVRGAFRGQPFEMPAFVPLIQVIQHGAEHRTNITTTLAALKLEPPGTDAWSYWRAGLPE